MDYSGIVGVDSVSVIFNETAAEAAGADGIAGMVTASFPQNLGMLGLLGIFDWVYQSVTNDPRQCFPHDSILLFPSFWYSLPLGRKPPTLCGPSPTGKVKGFFGFGDKKDEDGVETEGAEGDAAKTPEGEEKSGADADADAKKDTGAEAPAPKADGANKTAEGVHCCLCMEGC